MSRRLSALCLLALLIPLDGRADAPPGGVAQPSSLLPSPLDDAPLQIDQKIDMERLQTRELAVEGVQRFLVVDPSVIDVTRLPNADQIVVHALSLGTTLRIP